MPCFCPDNTFGMDKMAQQCVPCCFCARQQPARKAKKIKGYKPPQTPPGMKAVVYEPCVHLHFKPEHIDRECLTREQYYDFLATPKGYPWLGEADCQNPELRVKTKSKKKKKPKQIEQEECPGRADAGDFADEFVEDMWDVMSPEITCRLIDFLVNEFGMSVEEAEDFIDCKICVGKQTICKKKKSKTTIGLGPKYKWVKEFSDVFSKRIEQYIINMLMTRRTPRTKRIAEKILECLCDLTGEKTTLQNPKTKIQRIMVLISDRLALWIDDMMNDIDKPHKKRASITEEEAAEEEEAEEEGAEEGEEEAVAEEEKQEPPKDEKPKEKAKTPEKEEENEEDKTEEPPAEKEEEKELEPAKEPEPEKEEPQPAEEEKEEEPVQNEEKEEPKAEEKPEEPQPEEPTEEQPAEEKTEEPAAEETPADVQPEAEEETKPAEEAEEAPKGEEEVPAEEEAPPQDEATAEEAPPQEEAPAEETPAEEEKPAEEEEAVEEPPAEEEKVPEEEIVEEKPPEEPEAVKEEVEKEREKKPYGDVFDLVKEDIEGTPKDRRTDRQKADKDEVIRRIEKHLAGKDLDIQPENIDDAASRVAHWMEHILGAIEPSGGVRRKNPSPAFAVNLQSGSTLEVHKLSSGTVAQKTANARGVPVPPRERKVPDTLSPMNLQSTQEWFDWANNIGNVADEWGKWLESTLTDAEKQIAEKKKADKDFDFKKWRDQAQTEAHKWRVEKEKIKGEGNLWNKKIDKKLKEQPEKEVRSLEM